ncbi:MAG: NAD(P)-dependent oxidoreductase [Pseudomonadota bacterium]
MERIGFIGLGVMGEAMCGNLARRGRWQVIAHDLRAEPLERLAEDGVTPGSMTDAAACDLVITCLPGGDQVRALVLGELLDAMFAGAVLVDMSTSPPDLMREIEAAAGEKGVAFADAPIARTRQAAAEGKLAIMVGASDDTLTRIRPVMETMGSDVLHCGPVGAGQVIKILNNMVLFQTVNALAEAAEIAEGAGLSTGALFEALKQGSADSFALRAHGMKSLLPRDYPDPAFSVRYAAKDLAYALDMAEAAGMDAAGADLIRRRFEAAEAAGDGDKYWPVIRETIGDKT